MTSPSLISSLYPVNPTFFFGPFTKHFPIHAGDFGTISTDLMVYNFLFRDGSFPFATFYIDVRDVAQAHVRALNSRPTAEVGRKRIIFSSPYGWPFQKMLDFIAEQRPALKDRLITATPQVHPFDVLPVDFARVENVLGMTVSDFHTVEEVSKHTRFGSMLLMGLQTTLDSVDALIDLILTTFHGNFHRIACARCS